MSNVQQAPKQFDAVVVGAGVAGLYSIYKLRAQGLSVQAFEAGTGTMLPTSSTCAATSGSRPG